MGYYRSRGAYQESEWLEAQAKIVEKKKKYLRQMPVKTFFEFIRKEAEEHNAKDHHSSYDFDSQMHSHMGYFREWTDTISLLDDIIGTQHTQENKPTPMGLVTGNDGRVIAQGDPIELSKPRRWRLTEFHDHLMGIQWKTRNEDFNSTPGSIRQACQSHMATSLC